jgi:hypothetical protein
MLARYPTSQASVKRDDEDDEHDNGLLSDPQHSGYEEHDEEEDDDDDEGNWDDRSRRKSGDDDLFFTLTARQMGKLFRTKRSLCNQPMTLRVNKTVFCCHAVLLEETNHIAENSDKNKGTTNTSPVASDGCDKKGDGDENGDKEDSSLSLFSVVVALAPSTQQSALPFSSFWDFDGSGGGEDRSDLERYIRRGGVRLSQTRDDGKTSKNNASSTKNPQVESGGTNTKHGDAGEKRFRMKQKKKQTAARVSSVFLAIRRVHISLVRFCRALEREENRCGYVTFQSRALFQIRNERQKQWDVMHNRNPRPASASPMPSTTTNNSGGGNSDRSPYSERGVVGLGGVHHHHTPRHSRQNSFISTPGGGNTLLSDATLKKALDNDDPGGEAIGSVEQEQEKEQEVLELMLACNPQDKPEGQHQQSYQNRQHGNLVRDLVAVFHSLSRNDHEYPPTPSSLLCERDAVVYVNQHFAIPIDAAGLSGHSQMSSSRSHKIGSFPIAEGGRPVVRPYYTLLFPHASPSDLLETFHSSGSTPPQQLEHFLLTVNPQKPLTQIATDANLPMHTTMQIASFLIAHGACTTSPVVSPRSRLTCFGSDSMTRIPELALDFSQAFPGVSLFGVVSFLTTSSRHLGGAMAILVDTENEEGTWLRESLLASNKYRYHDQSRGVVDGDKVGPTESATSELSTAQSTYQSLFPDKKNESYAASSRGGVSKPSGMAPEPTPMSVHEWLKDLEELLFSIAVWLLSHRVLVQLQEYMVVVAEVSSAPSNHIGVDHENDSSTSVMLSPPSAADTAKGLSAPVPANTTTAKSSSNDWGENLFRELLEMEYLNGDISIMALSWRMAIDPRKLRRWGWRHKRVRVISRVPSPGDDWEPATTKTPSPLSPPEPPPLSSPAPPSDAKVLS